MVEIILKQCIAFRVWVGSPEGVKNPVANLAETEYWNRMLIKVSDWDLAIFSPGFEKYFPL